MKKKMLKTILVDVNANSVEVVDVADDLDAFYKLLDCRCFDIVSRPIGGKTYDVMLDDEGLFRSDATPSAMSVNGNGEVLVGNLMFFRNNGRGDLKSLTDKDIEHIKKHIGAWLDDRNGKYTLRPVVKIW